LSKSEKRQVVNLPVSLWLDGGYLFFLSLWWCLSAINGYVEVFTSGKVDGPSPNGDFRRHGKDYDQFFREERLQRFDS